MTKRAKDVPGNSELSALVFAEQMLRIGETAWGLDYYLRQLGEAGFEIKALRFSYPAGSKGDVLCVVTADSPSGPVVAFHNGSTFAETMQGVITRLGRNTLKWKADQYGQP